MTSTEQVETGAGRAVVGRVLVVNDDGDAARLLAIELAQAGYRNVFTCISAENALEALDHGPKPALVISDIHMGGLDGFQLCRLLKSPAYRDLNDVPVILFSASFRDTRALDLAREAGAVAFLENPRDKHLLEAVMAEALGGRAESRPESLCPPAGSASPSRVLLATGDDATAVSLLSELERTGVRFDRSESCEAVRAAVRRRGFDIVLLGDDLPGEGSVELVQFLRRELPELPVCILGGQAMGGRFAELLRAGVDDYLERPFTGESIRDAWRRAHVRRELRSTSVRIESSEARLRVSEDRCRRQSSLLENLMETSGDGIVLCDSRLRVAKLNKAAAEIFALMPGAAIGRSVRDLVGTEPLRRFEAFLGSPEGTKAQSFEIVREIDARSKVLSIGLSKSDEIPGAPGLLLIIRDMTGERQLRLKVAQSQKMDCLGALAGGMAHDFNNILATILPNAEMIRMLVPEPANESVFQRARAIELAARRGAELTRRLLAFLRPRNDGEASADPNQSIESIIAMLRETFDRKIRVESGLMDGSVSVAMDASQLEHVLLNFAINARDAMPDGGTLRFETSVEEAPAADSRKDAFVCITITDTGCGMTPEVAERVFDPFFTTKDEGAGTGLGLSTARENVRAAGGHIDVQTSPGKGTRFRIFLPATTRVAGPPVEKPVAVQGRREHILVVDDEEAVRDLVGEMLSRLNYEVHSVSSGAEAIDYFRENPDVDLVILDMIMPDMDGRQTYDALMQSCPGLRTVLTSGDAQNSRAAKMKSEGVIVLDKPFTMASLSTKVRAALENRKSPAPIGQTA